MTGFSANVRAVVEGRSGGMCEVCGEGRVTEIHHRRPRGMGGSSSGDTNKPSNALALCNACHRMIESNRAVAMLLGWLMPQRTRNGASPSGRRVMYRGAWVFLADDGNVWTAGRATPC